MAVEPTYEIVAGEVIRKTAIAGQEVTDTRSAAEFTERLRAMATYDTGLLPVHVRYVLRDDSYVRLVLELPPATDLVRKSWQWVDPKNRCKVAMPWRIAVVDFHKREVVVGKPGEDTYYLYGARVFYTTQKMDSLDHQLYHTNFPNVNSIGPYNYGGEKVAVGWVCFYHSDKEKLKTVADMAQCAVFRLSGDEPFNDNMSGVDGARLYKLNSPKHGELLSNFEKWEKYTEEHGVIWTLDPELWLPVLVDKNQDRHVKGGKHLTVADCLFDPNPRMYYTDERIRGWYPNVKSDPMKMIKAAFTASATEDNARAALLANQMKAKADAAAAKKAETLKLKAEVKEKLVGKKDIKVGALSGIAYNPAAQVVVAEEAPVQKKKKIVGPVYPVPCAFCNSEFSGTAWEIIDFDSPKMKTLCPDCHAAGDFMACPKCYGMWDLTDERSPSFWHVHGKVDDVWCTPCIEEKATIVECTGCGGKWDNDGLDQPIVGLCPECT